MPELGLSQHGTVSTIPTTGLVLVSSERLFELDKVDVWRANVGLTDSLLSKSYDAETLRACDHIG